MLSCWTQLNTKGEFCTKKKDFNFGRHLLCLSNSQTAKASYHLQLNLRMPFHTEWDFDPHHLHQNCFRMGSVHGQYGQEKQIQRPKTASMHVQNRHINLMFMVSHCKICFALVNEWKLMAAWIPGKNNSNKNLKHAKTPVWPEDKESCLHAPADCNWCLRLTFPSGTIQL